MNQLVYGFIPGTNPSTAIQQTPAPMAVTDLAAVEMENKQIQLNWSVSLGAIKYKIYRSLIQGTYSEANLIDTLTITTADPSLTYWDQNFDPGIHDYYYVITAVDSQNQASGYSNEVIGRPHYAIGWAGTVYADNMDTSFTYTLGDPTQVKHIAGEIYIPGQTGTNVTGSEPENIWAQFGYGPKGGDPNEDADLSQWSDWVDASYTGLGIWNEANSRYLADFIPERPGDFYFAYRFSTNGGRNWVYTDLVSYISDPSRVPGSTLGSMTIQSSPDDTTPPDEFELAATVLTPTTIKLTWDAPSSTDTYGYLVYRSLDADSVWTRITKEYIRVAPLEFIDANLVSGTEYSYKVIAVDNAFNARESNIVSSNTTPNSITITINVTIPYFTPEGPIYINRVIDPETKLPGQEENWTGIPVTCNINTNHCSVQLTLQENTPFNFRFSRGSEQTIQTQADGNTSAIDPSFMARADTTTINRLIANWDDPLISSYTPQGETVSPNTKTIAVTWNQAMASGTQFTVLEMGKDGLGPSVMLGGVFTYEPDMRTVYFTSNTMLKGHWQYRIQVDRQKDQKGPGILQQSQVAWSFATSYFYVYLPHLKKP